MGISAERYHEVWGSLSGSLEHRATHYYSSTGGPAVQTGLLQ
ncbi:unnamed protein product [Chondrus crispus]|uniref:Uncharacterized protein n=1 Tax=Chondrus crispus TaxID=2769 RepID=R7Q7F9_CHOCR|nr:unnamed protein product [Chondrus crispus]CDF33954.1 unnamed protein product [Chondrus crispus]|eukprot:XP_005713773.1 unnamed protein product [Chondrus crispus]